MWATTTMLFWGDNNNNNSKHDNDGSSYASPDTPSKSGHRYTRRRLPINTATTTTNTSATTTPMPTETETATPIGMKDLPVVVGSSSNNSRNRRRLIVGGEPAQTWDDYGFFVHFGGDGMCGGSLIAPKVVLTAGHCWTSSLEEVWIGPLYENDNDSQRRKRRLGRVAEYRRHPYYDAKSSHDYDFLLLRLSSVEMVEWQDETSHHQYQHGSNEDEVGGVPWRDDLEEASPWQDDVDASHRAAGSGDRKRQLKHDEEELQHEAPSYIRLNHDPSIPVDYSPLTVIGMGYVNAQEEAKTLQHLRSNQDGAFESIPTQVCNGPNSYDGSVSEETMICAGTMKGGRDACMGDSGGPLLQYETYGGVETPLQVGLVSWGMGCGLPRLPSVYARVSSAYGWIREVVCGDWRRTIIEADDDSSAGNESEHWFLCKDYNEQQMRNRTGGIFSASGKTLNHASCDETTEVSFEFRLTADAYGWEVSWELLSNHHATAATTAATTTRVAGDQLFNDHETRLYHYCLPRLSGDGDCFALNVHDSLHDGMGYKTKTQVGSRSDARGGAQFGAIAPNATLNGTNSTADPAGFGIRFGNAPVYQDFGFPEFGGTATFALCPAALDVTGDSGNMDDTIVVVNGAPAEEPTPGPSEELSASSTLGPSEQPSASPTTSPWRENLGASPWRDDVVASHRAAGLLEFSQEP